MIYYYTNERRGKMFKNMKIVLIGIAVIIIGGLAISCYVSDMKAKQSAKEVVVLNDLIKEKDAAINKLMGEMQSKQQELNGLKKDLENVKTELSNTVLKLQVSTPASTTPVSTTVKTPVKAPAKK